MLDKYSLLILPIAIEARMSEYRKREKEKFRVLHDELDALEAEDPSTLHWRAKNKHIVFWKLHNRKQYGITKDINKIYSLARLAFLRLFFDPARDSAPAHWASSMNDLLQSFCDAGLDIMRIVLTKAQYEWASNPHSQNPNRTDHLRYKTTNGVLVRSKSEQFIGNLLEELGIPYRYEPELRIGNRILHPDFVIMTTDGRKIILEHFGRMDLKDYVYSAMDRLSSYSFYGLELGRDVFVSFESHVRSREAFMPIIYQIMAA